MSQHLAATLARAASYADAQAHPEVTLEHLLLALAEDPDAAGVLRSSNVDLARLAAEVSAHIGQIEDRRAPDGPGQVFISNDLRRILEAAAAAARQGRRSEINGAIVLAAIVGDGKSTAAHLLRAQGLTFEQAIRALQKSNAPAEPRASDEQTARPAPAAESAAGPPLRGSTEDILSGARERVQSRTGPPAAHPATSPVMTPEASAPQPAPAPAAAREVHPQPVFAPSPPERAPAGDGLRPRPDYSSPLTAETTQPPRTMPPPAPREVPVADPRRSPLAPQWQPAGPPPLRSPQPIGPADAGRMPGAAGAVAPNGPYGAPAAPPSWAPPGGSAAPSAAPAPRPPPPVNVPQNQPGGPRTGPPSGFGAPPPGHPMPPGAGGPPPPFAAPPGPLQAQRAPGPPGNPRIPPPVRQRQSGPSGTVRVAAGQLVENIPRRMRVAIPVVVEARVARAEVKAIAEGLQGGGAVYRHEVTVTKAMSVRLRAPDGGFWIETSSPETQWIENVLGLMADDFASWRWTVTPRERGKKRLQLLISARTVGADGLATETALPDQVIEVKVGVNYAQTAVRWAGWMTAAVFGGVLARFGEGLFEPLFSIIRKLTGS